MNTSRELRLSGDASLYVNMYDVVELVLLGDDGGVDQHGCWAFVLVI